jgi:hypothetical protein
MNENIMASFDKIDYRLRPAKAIERKMIAESIHKLSIFHKIEDYRYVGFGSIYFADFTLFHKILGIKEMISIEHNLDYEERVRFNLPYSFIDLRCESSNAVLPLLDWQKPTIIWLDYDFPIAEIVLNDISTVCANAVEGSLLLVTVNANQVNLPENQKDKDLDEFRLKDLEERVGEEKIPSGITGKDLNSKEMSIVLRKIFLNEIHEHLKNRSQIAMDDGQKFMFKQLFNFKYEDGAKMLTFGGVILKNYQESTFNKANFSDLDFLSFDEKEYKIEVPKLTFREINHLDSKLHKQVTTEGGKLKIEKQFKKEYSKFLKEEDILKYYKIYRYYPNFTETIL